MEIKSFSLWGTILLRRLEDLENELNDERENYNEALYRKDLNSALKHHTKIQELEKLKQELRDIKNDVVELNLLEPYYVEIIDGWAM